VQGWAAKFEPSGVLVWLVSLVGNSRNVVADLSYVRDERAVVLSATYQSNCTITTVDNDNTTTYSLAVNGTTARALLLASVAADDGSWRWYQTAGDDGAAAITCDSYHYVTRALPGSDVYVAGCFSGALALHAQAARGNASAITRGNDTLLLSGAASFNAIYVLRLDAHNGSLVWARALLGANIRDYSFAVRATAHALLDDDDTEIGDGSGSAAASPSGVLVAAFVQGDCFTSALLVPRGAGSAHCDVRRITVNASALGYGGECECDRWRCVCVCVSQTRRQMVRCMAPCSTRGAVCSGWRCSRTGARSLRAWRRLLPTSSPWSARSRARCRLTPRTRSRRRSAVRVPTCSRACCASARASCRSRCHWAIPCGSTRQWRRSRCSCALAACARRAWWCARARRRRRL
jgi:hypothetical protein